MSTQPIQKSITVKRDVEGAFDLFTRGMGTWWPLASHSVAQADAATCVLEPRVGGRIFERAKDGTEHAWGKVLAWEPPARLVFAFRPGRFVDDGSPFPEVEVRFTRAAEGTRVDLEHRGWDRLGEGAAEARASYHSGWDLVFGEAFASAARLAA